MIRKLKTHNPPLSKSPESATMLRAKLRYTAMMMIRRVVSTTSISMTRRIPKASLTTTTVVAFAKNTTATFTRVVLRSILPPKLMSKHRVPWTQEILFIFAPLFDPQNQLSPVKHIGYSGWRCRLYFAFSFKGTPDSRTSQ